MRRARWLRRTVVATIVAIVVVPTVALIGFRAAAWRRETQTRAAAAEQGRDLARLIRASSWTELAGAGHIPAIEATERFNAALLAFLDLDR